MVNYAASGSSIADGSVNVPTLQSMNSFTEQIQVQAIAINSSSIRMPMIGPKIRVGKVMYSSMSL